VSTLRRAFPNEELRGVRTPTLLLVGQQEALYDPVAAAERAQRLMPDIQTQLIPQAGHDLPAKGAMATRAALAWLVFVVLAMLNGGLRQTLLVPRIGERAGHVVSTLLLSALVLAAAWPLLRWIRPATVRDAWLIGALWLLLTVAFEFLAGHYLFGSPWGELAAAYDIWDGQIWILVLVTTLIAPVLVRAWQLRVRTRHALRSSR
jgi:hypothetical protein